MSDSTPKPAFCEISREVGIAAARMVTLQAGSTYERVRDDSLPGKTRVEIGGVRLTVWSASPTVFKWCVLTGPVNTTAYFIEVAQGKKAVEYFRGEGAISGGSIKLFDTEEEAEKYFRGFRLSRKHRNLPEAQQWTRADIVIKTVPVATDEAAYGFLSVGIAEARLNPQPRKQMSDIESHARTNYFRVRDEVAFAEWAKENDLEVVTSQDGQLVSLRGELFNIVAEPVTEADEQYADEYLTPAQAISPHLADGEVCVVMQTGRQGLRYLSGRAVAFDADGQEVSIDLRDIYAKAKEAFGVEPTKAEY